MLNGRPFRFTGFNIYNANSRNNCWYSLGFNDGALASTLARVGSGSEAFRSWFYQGLAVTDGVRDWSAFDHTLAVARAAGKRVVVQLTGQGGDCQDYPRDTPKGPEWYRTAYRKPEASGVSYYEWVREVVTRYANDPAILAYMLVGEAEAGTGVCPADDQQLLRGFVDDVGAMIKSIDPRHLVTLGVIGSGQCGTSGKDYVTVHASRYLDMCTREDYGFPSEPMPGDQWNGMRVRIEECHALGKPIFVSESGIKATVSDRAAKWDAKFSAQFNAGVVGELIWNWSNGPVGDPYAVYPTETDILDVLARY